MGHPLSYFAQLSTNKVAQGYVWFSYFFVARAIPLMVCFKIDLSSFCVCHVPISQSDSSALCLQQFWTASAAKSGEGTSGGLHVVKLSG